MYELIEYRRITTPTSTITFSSIPQNYTDLVILASAKSLQSTFENGATIVFNGNQSGYSERLLIGSGSGAGGTAGRTNQSGIAWSFLYAGSAESNTTNFANTVIHISNYSSTTRQKAISSDSIVEWNRTAISTYINAALWTETAAITSMTITTAIDNFAVGTSVTLYGVNRRSGIGRAPLAMGGYMSYSNGYWVHTFPSSGSFIPFTNMDVEYVVVAGGGGGSTDVNGGGGAGGYRSSVIGELSGGGSLAESRLSLTANTNYIVTIGAGGARGVNGSNSVFSTITSTGGGRGGNFGSGADGGSGGGAGYNFGVPGLGTASQGFNGGARDTGTIIPCNGGGGGGGAGSVGGSGVLAAGGMGGDGIFSSITGSPVARAGGGGGGGGAGGSAQGVGGAGGAGGGGAGATFSANGVAGTANTGGGGGGGGVNLNGSASSIGAAGGSGIVIVRYKA